MQKRAGVPLLAVGALLLSASARAEDIAIVTGIGDYVQLPTAHLDGIDNDVENMVVVLKAAGFKTMRLYNEKASEAGIRSAFAQAASRVGVGDRFVYYQSSHGAPDYRLLTYDTTTEGAHMLSVADVKGLLAQIHTAKKSVILDACFSGGFKDRGGLPSEKEKFFPIQAKKAINKDIIRDRTDTVVREYTAMAVSGAAKRDFAIFASSQDNQTSLVARIEGKPCSIFTHYLAKQLAGVSQRAWNDVVQPTISGVIQETGGRQTPAFDSDYLPYIVYTTGTRAAGGNAGGTRIHDFGQLYDVNNVQLRTLALSAKLSGPSVGDGEAYLPGTKVKLQLKISRPGYLFVINRDDEDKAQMVGWGTEDLDFSNPERMTDQSYVAQPEDFEFGKGTLKILTSNRSGIEHWKAFFFTSHAEAMKFAQLWNQLTTDKSLKVRRKSFFNSKTDEIFRVTPNAENSDAVYTSEVHYKVASR